MNSDDTYKYYQIYTNPHESKGMPSFSIELTKITGYYPEDYIPPVTAKGGDIVELISDESAIQDMLCVSLIILPMMTNETRSGIESDLENLVKQYSLSNIHFVDIFGRNNVLGNRTESFLEKYTEIVSVVPMSALALCRDKNDLLHELVETNMENELLYFQLFWNNFERVLPILRPFSIIHIWWEQENNLSVNLGNKLIQKLYAGFREIEDRKLNINSCSICKHPQFYSKKALFFSSISDVVAYVTNKISFSLWKGVPEKKILNDPVRARMLKTLKDTIRNYTGLPIRALIEKA